METFDPNDIGIANGNFFGLPYDVEDSMLVLLPVTWDATVSYGKGTAGGAEAMLNASLQIDLFDEKIPDVWKNRIATLPFDSGIETLNRSTRPVAEEIIDKLSHGASAADLGSEIERVNRASAILNGLGFANDDFARTVAEFSGGWRMRLAFAAALFQPSDILLLDEAFSALDALTRSKIYPEFIRIHERQPVTTVLVTHDVTEAVLLSRNIYRLGKGRLLKTYCVDQPYPRTLATAGVGGLIEDILKDFLTETKGNGYEA